MAMNPRIGQSITLFLIVAMIALWIVSFFFPWMIVKGETPRCEWNQEWGWDDMITVNCPSECAFNYANCSAQMNTTWQCPPTLKNWRPTCDDRVDGGWKCIRQAYVTVSVWGIVIGTICWGGLVLFSYILSFFAIGSTASLVLLVFNMVWGLAACVGYAVGIPIAVKDDYIDSFELSSGAACASDNTKTIFFGCGQFVAQHTQTCGPQQSTFSWGPGIGWIVFTVGLIVAFIALMTMVLIGRGKRKLNMF